MLHISQFTFSRHPAVPLDAGRVRLPVAARLDPVPLVGGSVQEDARGVGAADHPGVGGLHVGHAPPDRQPVSRSATKRFFHFSFSFSNQKLIKLKKVALNSIHQF